MKKPLNGVATEVDEIFQDSEREAEAARIASRSGNGELGTSPVCQIATCLSHSGVKQAVKYLAREQDRQYEMIDRLYNRMWAILIGVCGTFFLVLVQFLYYHITRGTIAPIIK